MVFMTFLSIRPYTVNYKQVWALEGAPYQLGFESGRPASDWPPGEAAARSRSDCA